MGTRKSVTFSENLLGATGQYYEFSCELLNAKSATAIGSRFSAFSNMAPAFRRIS